MDHEFGTSFLETEQVGWDWFSIQLDDGRELMIFEIRRADGSIDPRSSGTFIAPDGRATHIPFGEFTLTPVERWRSERSGASYPVRWSVAVPAYELYLTVAAAFNDQELSATQSTGVTYWEGSIEVRGRAGAGEVTGRGYLEMTGYAGGSMGAIFQR
jgi:predicted secreted hydrolase